MNFISLSSPRILEERLRLGLNQGEAGAACGVSREMWGKYERAKAAIGGESLFLFSLAGADVQYIVTGVRKGSGIGESAIYQATLEAVEVLSLEKKLDAEQFANAVVKISTRNSEWAKLAVPPLNQMKSRATGEQATGTNSRRIGQQINAPVSGTVAGRDIIQNGRKKKKDGPGN